MEETFNKDLDIDYIIKLYNLNNNQTGIFVSFNPSGYAIFDYSVNRYKEYSDNNHNYIKEDNRRYIYLDFNNCFIEKNSQSLINIITSQTIDKNTVKKYFEQYNDEEIKYKEELCSYLNAQTYNISSFDVSVQEYNNINTYNNDCPITYFRYEHLLPNYTCAYDCNISDNAQYFGYNKASFYGVCGSVSAAVLLAYYDDYINDNYISNNSLKTSGSSVLCTYGRELTKLLVPYIEIAQNGGSTVYSLNDGINSYLKKYNINNSASYKLLFKRIELEDKIKANRPVIVSLNKYDEEDVKHWVVVDGYSRNGYRQNNAVTITSDVIRINDGYGNNKKYVDYSTAGRFLVFLNS